MAALAGLPAPSTRTLRRLAIALALATAGPWLAGQWAQRFVQPGLVDDAERLALLIDYAVSGAMLTGLSLALAYGCGLWLVDVMQGPARRGDPFPGADDDAR